MSLVWLVPAAFFGLLALAVPILVHLLARQERRAIEFPSLRFLQATRLSATRRHRLRDWLLLLVRAATIAVAVAALAGPLFVTPARERGWSARIARAIVVVDEADVPAAETEAFRSRAFPARARASAAIRAGVEWLATQPPASRELLIAGDLREDTIDDGDVASVPAHVGMRFAPRAEATPAIGVTVPVLTLVDGRPVIDERRVRLSPQETVVQASGDRMPVTTPPVEVRAASEDQRTADAALDALLAEGVVADSPGAPRVIVVWPGGIEPQAGEDVRVVRVAERPSSAAAVQVLRDIAARALDDPATPREPRRVSAADLARWSRPPDGVPSDTPRRDEGDRRWLWVAVLALLTVEWLLRRDRRDRASGTAAADEGTFNGERVA